MTKQAWWAALACLLALAAAPAWGQATGSQPKVTCRLMGNGDYLLLAAEVEDPNLIGTNSEPMSAPWNDDAIDFFLDLSGGKEPQLGPHCVRLAISAAGNGGFIALVGDEAGVWRPNNGWLAGLKFDIAHKGTLNKPTDTDQSWTVEAAIPWAFLGGLPRDGRVFGFNVVCHMRGENEGFVSWSSKVKEEADFDNPATWGTMTVRYSAGGASQADQCLLPMGPYPVRVDGRLDAIEWIVANTFTFTRPAPEFTAAAATTGGKGRAPLLLGLYRYDYQGDDALPGAGRAIWQEGRSALADHPREGVGPLFSGLRADWHEAQAGEARRAGLDGLLTVWPAEPAARVEWGRPGMGALVAALRRLNLAGRNYPLLAPYVDVSETAADWAADPAALYRLVKEYFDLAPAQLRLQLDPRGAAGRPTYLAVLSAPAAGANWSERTLVELRKSFEKDFGASLALLVHPDWRSKAAGGADGVAALGTAEVFYDQSGSLAVATLAPGAVRPLRDRDGGRQYDAAWLKVTGLDPDLLILDSWNDFTRGTEVAPSAEYGVVYADATRAWFTRMITRRKVQVSVRRATVPAVMLPATPYQVELVLRNEGFADLRVGPTITMIYRLVNEADPKISYKATATEGLRLAAGQSAAATFTVSAGEGRQPLPAGRYRLSFEVTKSSVPLLTTSWFSRQLSTMTFPVIVGQPAPLAVTVLDDGLPGLVPAGGTAAGYLRLRNDSRTAWRGAKLAVEWRQAGKPIGEPFLTGLPETAPGRAVTVKMNVPAVAAGRPLPPSGADTSYELWCRLLPAKGEGVVCHRSPIVVASGLQAEVAQLDLPAVTAGGSVTAKLALKNKGAARWTRGESAVTLAWLRWDGAPAGAATEVPLPADTAPGQAVVVSAPLEAPALPGNYRLAIGLAAGQERLTLSSPPVAVAGDSLVAVQIEGNVVGSTSDRRRSAGSFDGYGRSFPAEALPPDVSGAMAPLYPLGYGVRPEGPGQLVSFRWPDTTTGRGAALGCRSQTLDLAAGSYAEVWVVAAGTDPTSGDFTLVYADGAQAIPLQVASWTEPAADSIIAARSSHVHAVQGDEATPACLYAYRLPADPARQLKGLKLPGNERIRVFAVTGVKAK